MTPLSEASVTAVPLQMEELSWDVRLCDSEQYGKAWDSGTNFIVPSGSHSSTWFRQLVLGHLLGASFSKPAVEKH